VHKSYDEFPFNSHSSQRVGQRGVIVTDDSSFI